MKFYFSSIILAAMQFSHLKGNWQCKKYTNKLCSGNWTSGVRQFLSGTGFNKVTVVHSFSLLSFSA